ncbi:hypothetical protein M2375_000902 [Comamonas sp. BIGb0152]|uniref:hypothetical protein n=1 Tax=Comamonas sp. BIGb0152 TaxID=2940601 RepID=UPI002169C858|nr:hypothetical protein [Comamonas sp. BIGb0152]MCS4292696.1 hypothetical protein [Comamonas sp. BIGb0152]
MRHPLNRSTPRTMGQAWGHGPGYYDPFEHYTKPLTQRLSFWLALVIVLGLIAFIWSRYA